MNAADQLKDWMIVRSMASVVTLTREYFPAASVSLRPWRDDPETRRWIEKETLDLAFYFPGWTSKLQCRSFLVQLRLSSEIQEDVVPHLLGVLIRGMTYQGERWRLVTLGEWEPTGEKIPARQEIVKLQELCRKLFLLFPSDDSRNQAGFQKSQS